MKIAIIGAGAIGSLTGALLWEHGLDVTLIGRADQVSAIKRGGLVVDGILDGKRFDVPAAERLDFKPDMALLAVKTHDLESACREAMPWLGEAVIVTMQNGVRSDEIAAGVLGRERLVSAVVMFAATYVVPGRITYNFPGGFVIGKAFDNAGEYDVPVAQVRRALSTAFDVQVSADIHGTHWTKLILNLNNALPAVLGVSMQEVFEHEPLCRVGTALMREAHGVMSAAGVKLMPLPDLPVEKLTSLIHAPAEVGAGIYGGIMRGLSYYPLPGSVLQSLKRGRATEVDYLNGEIAALGESHGRPAPLNRTLTGLVKDVEATGRFMTVDELLSELRD